MSPSRRRLTGLIVGLALALGAVFALVAAPSANTASSPGATAMPATAAEATALPTPDPNAMFDLMVSESDYCQCNK
ncbi:MAG TPA: hypothetical protein VGM69_05135 [Chloroflexota bacterium]|jgi:hypothetical protein